MKNKNNNGPHIALKDMEGLKDALGSDDLKVRLNAIKKLRMLGDRRSMGLLVDSLKDEHFDARETAYRALCKVGYRAMPVLLQALDDKNFYIRMYAALVITEEIKKHPGRKYGAAVIDALTHSLKDKSIYVRRSAYEALESIILAKAEKRYKRSLGLHSARSRTEIEATINAYLKEKQVDLSSFEV